MRQVFIGQERRLRCAATMRWPLNASCMSSANAPSRPSAIAAGDGANQFYVASLSSRTIVYKGMLLADQVDDYYPDLLNPDVEVGHRRGAFALSAPIPSRAGNARIPYRYLIHNGEINTIRGNINWMYARQSTLKSDLFGDDLHKITQQIIDPDGSDSAQFDNAMEFLHLAGRPLHHVAMMMIPEPWSNHETCRRRSARSTNINATHDGAVGWPGLDCLYRWHGGWRGARSQWSAPVALLRDQR